MCVSGAHKHIPTYTHSIAMLYVLLKTSFMQYFHYAKFEDLYNLVACNPRLGSRWVNYTGPAHFEFLIEKWASIWTNESGSLPPGANGLEGLLTQQYSLIGRFRILKRIFFALIWRSDFIFYSEGIFFFFLFVSRGN